MITHFDHRSPYPCCFSDRSSPDHGADSAVGCEAPVNLKPQAAACMPSIFFHCAMAHPVFFGLSAETRDLLQRVIGFSPSAGFDSCSSRVLDFYEVFCGKANLSGAMRSVSCMHWI